MRNLFSASIYTIALLSSSAAYSATVNRCVDSAGHVTFTHLACAASQTRETKQVFNPTPGSGPAVPMAKSKSHNNQSAKPADEEQELTIVAEQNDGCGNRVTGSARRNAIIRQQIRAGMTRADVESALGTPDTITSNNGRTRLRYTDNNGKSRTVSFDEMGCVLGKR